MPRCTIHDFTARVARTKRCLEKVNAPIENKKLILEFDRACLAEGPSMARRNKLMRHMVDTAREFLTVPFRDATKADIQEAIARVEARDSYSPTTKRDVKITIRKFYTWLILGQSTSDRSEFPDLVAWIKPTVKKKDRCRVRSCDLISREEVERMIEAVSNPRNKALLALLYELGGRIGEIGNLRLAEVTRDDYSFLIDLDGKTGKRTVRLVMYASHLVTWLNLHPARHRPDAPLWPSLRSSSGMQALAYTELNYIIKKAAQRAGISRRVYPHLFRHSRVTHLLASGQMNEAQAKVFFGWVADSKILSTYSHLVASDANDAILRMYGIQKANATEEAQPIACGMCQAPNPGGSLFCFKCGYALSSSAPEEANLRQQRAEDVLERFLRRDDVRQLFMKMMKESPQQHSQRPSKSLWE